MLKGKTSMLLLATVWILSVRSLDPSFSTPPSTPYPTQEECNTAREDYIKGHMYKNWQGLTMAPPVSTLCTPTDPNAPNPDIPPPPSPG